MKHTLLFLALNICVCLCLSSKRGIAWDLNDYNVNVTVLNQFLPASAPTKISWIYNWNATMSQSIPSALQYIPMQWCWNNGIQNSASQNIPHYFPDNSIVLGFNEPDLANHNQCGWKDPTTAGTWWKNNMQPIKASKNLIYGTPAVTTSPATNLGADWLDKFLDACDTCVFDFLTIHWYGSNLGDFFGYLGYMQNNLATRTTSKKIWITEFAFTNQDDNNQMTSSQVYNLMEQAMYHLDKSWMIERYAAFGTGRWTGTWVGLNAAMLDITTSAINSLGLLYAHGWNNNFYNGVVGTLYSDYLMNLDSAVTRLQIKIPSNFPSFIPNSTAPGLNRIEVGILFTSGRTTGSFVATLHESDASGNPTGGALWQTQYVVVNNPGGATNVVFATFYMGNTYMFANNNYVVYFTQWDNTNPGSIYMGGSYPDSGQSQWNGVITTTAYKPTGSSTYSNSYKLHAKCFFY